MSAAERRDPTQRSADDRNGAKNDSAKRGFEQLDLSLRALFIGIFGTALLTAVFAWLMVVMFGVLEGRVTAAARPPSPLAESGVLPPEPRLETVPGQNLARLRSNEAALLGQYAWLDVDNGVARIPVERAMQILAARGLPYRAAEDEPTVEGSR